MVRFVYYPPPTFKKCKRKTTLCPKVAIVSNELPRLDVDILTWHTRYVPYAGLEIVSEKVETNRYSIKEKWR